MSGFERVHALMVEIGGLMELPRVSEYAEQRSWLLVTADGTVAVDLDEAGDRLLLSTGLGAPEPAARAEIYEALLLHNDQQPPLGGVRAGLDGLEGGVVLVVERPVSGLEVSGVVAALEELSAATRSWSERLAAPSGRSGEPFFGNMIRV